MDDYPENLELLKLALDHEGFSVTTTDSGEKALLFIEAANKSAVPYDCVLLDYAMPVMDGLTCALRIREYEELHREEHPVKLGFITAYPTLSLASSVLEKLKAHKTWMKTNLPEVVNDLNQWLCNDGCPEEGKGDRRSETTTKTTTTNSTQKTKTQYAS